MKSSLIILSLNFLLLPKSFSQGSGHQNDVRYEGKSIIQCYKKFPLLLSLLVKVSDDDFADKLKSDRRMKSMKASAKESNADLLACIKEINRLAVSVGDKEIIEFVSLRMGEAQKALESTVATRLSGQ